ncbi:MAG TPA: aminotransferase class I/II-fold pyridoxal phosphate-dependent enzyme [Silvibacterium sp.]|nr:aminotransferase class I/II-fold pyridoxal phosphate-dependent enzyme [Silvibacterium sp.]
MTKRAELRLAKRLDEVGFSDIVQIRNKVMELRASGQTVHAFHGGEPYFDTPEPIKYAMMKALVENKTRYAPSSGIDPLRAALAKKLREKNHLEVDAENVIVTAGGAHALHVAFQAVLNPGDDVLLFSPFWTPIRDMVIGAEARALLVPTTSARRSGLTKTLEQFSTPHTRAIYYNTPQNPAGTVFTRAEAEEVAAFAKKHNLIVIADEAYEDLVYEGEHFSIASLPGMSERTISTFTFSKSYAMTGWRVGYAVAVEPFMSGLRKLVLYSINGVATPTQWAALEALAMPQSMIDARREEYRAKRDLLVAGLCECGLPCDTPEGAFYAFPDVSKIHKDSRKAAAILLEKAHVATVPGVVFGAQGEGHVRFGYSISTDAIKAGLAALKSYVENPAVRR